MTTSHTTFKPSAIKRRAPLRRESAKQRARKRAWADVSARANEIARYRCTVKVPDKCWTFVTERAHHRLPKSQGGTDTLDNAVACCPACHDYLHLHPAWAKARGFIAVREGGGN